MTQESTNQDQGQTIREPNALEPDAGASSTSVSKPRLIAPWWHTVLLILLVMGNSLLGAKGMQRSSAFSHLDATYVATIGLECVFALLVLWGIHLRRVPLRQLLGTRRPGAKAWLGDAGAALAAWVIVLVVIGSIRLGLMRVLHTDPQNAAKVVLKLAPVTKLEMLLFLLLSVAAGVSEELVFRGYLQQQFARLSGRVWVGVAASALLFGAAHGYEGLDAMAAIAAFGAVLSILVLLRGGLRAAMILHAAFDAMQGVALALIHRYPVRGFPH